MIVLQNNEMTVTFSEIGAEIRSVKRGDVEYMWDARAEECAGSAPGTAWEDVPADFTCPVCGLGKDAFEVEE